ncbi:MAG: 23S rRNA pseudouridine1911/1915/1917 synthase [Bacteriovoracaceae bacterium]
MDPSNDKINFCFIGEFPSVMEGIIILTGLSKSQLKKFQLSKKYLQKTIRKGDIISLPINLLNQNMVNPVYVGPDVKILFENKNIITLSKPPRVHGHPLSYNESDNILSFLRKEGRATELEVNKANYDRGLLYRLDFETSGLIIYSKNEELYKVVRANLKEVIKTKTYLAVVDGKLNQEGLLTHYLKSFGKKGAKVEICSSSDIDSKKVECKVKLIEFNKEENLSLVEVELFQGARHQIRKQLEAIGNTIYGDPLYGSREAPRMYLHCWKYRIVWEEELLLSDNNLSLFLKLFHFNG